MEVGVRIRAVRRGWSLTWPPLREAEPDGTPPLAPPFAFGLTFGAQRCFGTPCFSAVRAGQAAGSSHQIDPRIALLGVWAVCLEPFTPAQNPATLPGARSIFAPDSLGHFFKTQSKKQIVQKIKERGNSV